MIQCGWRFTGNKNKRNVQINALEKTLHFFT